MLARLQTSQLGGSGRKGAGTNHLANASKLDPKLLQMLITITITQIITVIDLKCTATLKQHLVITGGGMHHGAIALDLEPNLSRN